MNSDQIITLVWNLMRFKPEASLAEVMYFIAMVQENTAAPTLPERPSWEHRSEQAAWAVDLLLNVSQFANTKQAVLDSLYQGKKIDAIKRLREDLGRDEFGKWISLAAAKDAVEDARIESLVTPF